MNSYYVEADGCYGRTILARTSDEAIQRYQAIVKQRTEGLFTPPRDTIRVSCAASGEHHA